MYNVDSPMFRIPLVILYLLNIYYINVLSLRKKTNYQTKLRVLDNKVLRENC